MSNDAHIFEKIPAHVSHRMSEKWNQKHAAELAKLREAERTEKPKDEPSETDQGGRDVDGRLP